MLVNSFSLNLLLTKVYQSRFAYVASLFLLTLQRSPVFLHLGKLQQALGRPLIQMSRAAAPLAVFLGGTHAVTGATAVVPAGTSAAPADATVGEEFTWAFRVVGETAASYSVLGLPAGLTKSDVVSRGVSSFGGIPEEAGTFEIDIIGWRGRTEGGSATPTYTLILNVDGGEPPAITTQLTGGEFDLGSSTTLELGVTGRGLHYRWLKDGQEIPSSSTPFIDETTEHRVLVPIGVVDDTWRTATDFDDSSWIAGAGGIGYDRVADQAFAPHIQTDLEAVSFRRNATALVRVPFTLTEADLQRANELKLRIQYDAGYVAYLNGARVSDANAPATLKWKSLATLEHGRDLATEFVDIDLAEHLASLKTGTNLLAIQALNRGARGTDFLINAELIGTRNTDAPALSLPAITTADAGAYSVEVSNATGSVLSETTTISLPQNTSPFTTWQTEKLTAVSSQDLAAPTADADGDGISNLLEYYYGTNPTQATTDVAPSAILTRTEVQDLLELRFSRANVAGVTPVFEMSSDLSVDSWQPMQSGIDGVVITHSDQESIVQIPANTGAQFVRLTLTLAD